jgi:hypothetical protein
VRVDRCSSRRASAIAALVLVACGQTAGSGASAHQQDGVMCLHISAPTLSTTAVPEDLRHQCPSESPSELREPSGQASLGCERVCHALVTCTNETMDACANTCESSLDGTCGPELVHVLECLAEQSTELTCRPDGLPNPWPHVVQSSLQLGDCSCGGWLAQLSDCVFLSDQGWAHRQPCGDGGSLGIALTRDGG